MNQSIAQEIGLLREILNQANDLGIVIGSHQNLDTYAASLALFASLKASGKKVQIVSKKSPTVEVSNLVGIDKVRDRFSAGNTSKLVISLPYIKGEVEKVLFTEFPNPQNPTNINFHLTAAEGKSITPFDLSDVKLIWEGGSPSVIITVGVSSVDELNGLVEGSSKVINIDNFQGNSRFGDVVLVDDFFSSLSEVSAKVIKDLGLPTDLDSAQNILDGILFATKNFTKQNTSPLAFEAASEAMYSGAKRRGSERQENSREQRQRPRFEERQKDPRSQQPRVNENDFPAMHMQGSQVRSDNDDRRSPNPQRVQGRDDRQRQFDQGRGGQQSFGQNPNDIEELMRKINEENQKREQNRRQSQDRQPRENQRRFDDTTVNTSAPRVQDAEILDERRSVQDNFEPEEGDYKPQDPSEVPDDWLMPKVFKSSKNNN